MWFNYSGVVFHCLYLRLRRFINATAWIMVSPGGVANWQVVTQVSQAQQATDITWRRGEASVTTPVCLPTWGRTFTQLVLFILRFSPINLLFFGLLPCFFIIFFVLLRCYFEMHRVVRLSVLVFLHYSPSQLISQDRNLSLSPLYVLVRLACPYRPSSIFTYFPNPSEI